jgi:Cu+-exporting ATPase
VGRSTVNFPRKEVVVAFDEQKLKLSDVVGLLASLGYEPVITLQDLEAHAPDPAARRLILKLGIAGFAFGNIMLLSFPSYLGLNPETEAGLRRFFGSVSIALALPVFVYSASDYWRGAWTCLRRRVLTIEFPIALGIAALFIQSVVEIAAGWSEGYLDSFSGLIFLLLTGKWFQRKTYETLSFERDFKSYFPLSITKRTGAATAVVPVTSLSVGDRIVVRNQELIPADAVLISGEACIDYSFVTGEAEPGARAIGDYLYAGGRQVGGPIELDVVKKVSQGYLTALWNNDVFHAPRGRDTNDLTNQAGRWFTYAVVAIAAGTAIAWSVLDPARAVRAFSSVLLVACPCALALAAPFTLGSALRILGRHRFYLRGTRVVEDMARVDALVFDKTGTLTAGRHATLRFEGEALTPGERAAVAALAAHSTHPMSRRIAEWLEARAEARVEQFSETPGAGLKGRVQGHSIRLGSAAWAGADASAEGVHLAIDGLLRGRFTVGHAFREATTSLVQRLRTRYRLALLSGDHPRERSFLEDVFGREPLRFQQTPMDKLAFVRAWQADGRRVMMIGDGLNDAGALRQSDVGVAVSDDVAAFSPACDAILDASQLARIPDFLRFSRAAVRVLLVSFALSLLYNVVGIGVAASGLLSPMVSAILMPLSSFTVISFSLLATRVVARRCGLR